MKALMFGWEFPPHILGGLGTASYGLTRGLCKQEDMEVTFVMPKPWGDEDKSFMRIIGMSQVPVVYRNVEYDQVKEKIGHLIEPELYFHLRNHIYADFSYLFTNEFGCIEFSGKYQDNLYEEINNYSISAGIIARAEHFDIIHAHDWLTYSAGIHAKQILGKPLVVHVHATDFDRSRGNVNPQVYNMEKNGFDHADHIMCVSEATRRIVIEKYHQNPCKVTAVHNAVTPLDPSILAIPDKRGVKEKIITFLGRITMQKGPEFFVEAAYRVLQKTNDVRFIMAGNGDMMDQMIRLSAERGISDHFHFTGFMKGNQVYEIYKASDVYVMPSVSEPFGIAPLEAMQCGVPCIISKQSGCAEILDYAIKVDYWDVDALADAMYALVTYPAMHSFLSEEGLKEVNNIKWEDVGIKIRGIYDQLLSSK
ncbi:MAG: glycosyltransferase family 4 protein [Bacteroidales bacterium]|uniref:glycosyltransferase family 4 protein n=1 Tax=Porphyromonas sp. TaxID=1924944 RepID=UPI002975B5EE|nr:glycosyltransferase family 4 protein [Porphyromonas sp.]MDD7438934.1 glycosyltransferase family 4 protein [Bacteroidales bacterium]MDY3067957.1 glycosyltransferase family 4 protein [Porphyromonas sp.]